VIYLNTFVSHSELVLWNKIIVDCIDTIA